MVVVVPDHIRDNPPRFARGSLRRLSKSIQVGIIEFNDVLSQAAMSFLQPIDDGAHWWLRIQLPRLQVFHAHSQLAGRVLPRHAAVSERVVVVHVFAGADVSDYFPY